MIPVRLEIKGLYSYLEEQTIDFTRLTEAGLFGIFGQVGSGKSTILEAMAFAIYGKIERLNKNKDDRYYNMLNLRSKEGAIDFTFIAGRKQNIYSVQVKLIRNPKIFEEVKLKEHKYYLHDGKALKPIDEEVVLNEVGVSYDNFKRTIIIPQGQFKEFLDLGPKDRTVMLQELFSLNKYDLSTKLGSIEKQNNSDLDNLKGVLSAKEDVSEEVIEQKKSELKKYESELKETTGIYIKEEAKLKEINQLEKDTSEFKSISSKYGEILKRAEEINRIEKEITEFEKIKSAFDNLLTQRNEIQKDKAERENDRNKLISSLSKANETNEKNKNEYNKYEKELTANEVLNQKTVIIDKIIDAKNKIKLFDVTQQRIQQSENSFHTNFTTKINFIKEDIQRLEAANESLKAFPLSDDYITVMSKWYDNAWHINNQYKKSVQNVSSKEKEFSEKQSGLKKHINDSGSTFFEYLADDINETEFEREYANAKNQIELKIEGYRKEKAELDVKHKLHEYASHLEDGKPCMLCGATEHPNPVESEKLDEALENIEKAINDSNQILKNFEAFKTITLKLFEQLNAAERNLQAAKTELSELNKNQLSINDQLPKGKFGPDDKNDFEAVVSKINEDKKQSAENDSNIKKQRKSLEDLTKEAEGEKKQIDELKNQSIIITTQLETLKNEIPSETWDEKHTKREDDLKKEVLSLKETIKRNDDNFNKYKKLFEDSAKQVTELNAKAEIAKKEVENALLKLEKANEKLNKALSEHKLEEAFIVTILAKKLDVVTVRKSIELYNKEKNTLEGALNVLKEKIANKTYDSEEHEKIKTSEKELKASIENLKAKSVELATELKRIEQELKDKKELLVKYEKLKTREDDISILKSLFKARGFVEFISRKYLQNVVAVANNRFYKMSRQKFKMELSAEADFYVRDYMNDGKKRLLKSLSGGQTFQAALCLALALSESIQRNAGINQQFFFLDEGFGTLDKDSLQIVFDALKSLRHENRVVGLISHVEELQQNLDVYLTIVNDQDKGSIIKESWKI